MKLLRKFALLILFFTGGLLAEDLTIMTEDLPPFNYRVGGMVTGFSVEIVEEICDRIGHPDKIKVLPWARAYNAILNEKNRVLFSMTRTPQREALFKWVGPLYEPTIVLYARKDSGLQIRSLADAKKVKHIGTYIDDAEETLLRNHGFTNLQSIGNDFNNAKKLAAGRIDLWIAGRLEGVYKARIVGVNPKLLENVFTIKKKQYYIAFSKDVHDSVIQQWQRILNVMLYDGSYQKILNKYL